jgi:hypothetical protein
MLPEVTQRIEALGFSPIGGLPDVFAKQLAAETEIWSGVIRAAGLNLQ